MKAVVFDFDGVVADSEPAHYEVFRRIFVAEGIDLSWQAYQEKYLGYDDPTCIQTVFSDNGQSITPERIQELVDRKNELFNAYIQNHSIILPGVRELIADLHRNDIFTAVCSGAARTEIDCMLGLGGMTGQFDVIVSANDVATSKPDPEGYSLTLKRLQQLDRAAALTATDCLVIEDSPFGIEAAKAAGMFCLAVKNSYPESCLERADAVCKSLEGLNAAGLLELMNGKAT